MRKIEFTKDWCLQMAEREGDMDISAGSQTDVEAEPTVGGQDEQRRVAFRRFVSLMRRKRGLSLEKLAEEADVELADLLAIEEEPHHTPEPRTVSQLAQVFRVPPKGLLQLSGLTQRRDLQFTEEAVRFAARSEPVEKLSKEEAAALEGFISVLAQHR